MDTLNYRVVARKSPSTHEVKYYANPVDAGTVTTDDLAKEIAGRCSLTYGDLLNVFRNLNDVIPKYLSMGLHVKLNGLGTLFLSLKSDGTQSKEEFKADNISQIRIRIYPATELKHDVLDQIRLEKVDDDE